MGESEMGGRAGRRQAINSFPMLGDLCEPGVHPKCVDANNPMARGALFKDAQVMVKFSSKTSGRNATKLLEAATTQVAQG